MTDIDPDDVKAMRRQGDFRAFLRQQIADGKQRRQPPTPAAVPHQPGHTPGAWPAGSRPPGPVKPQPPGAWDAALQRHRDGTQQGTTCECPGCTTPSNQEDQ